MGNKSTSRKRILISLLFFCLGSYFLPSWWCGFDSARWYRGDKRRHVQLAEGVSEWIGNDLDRKIFSTGDELFDGEWLFGTYVVAAMGYGQTALEHPELTRTHLKQIETCIDHLLTDKVKVFDYASWGNDPIETLDSDSDHAAYLGYLNLVLSMHRYLEPKSRFSDLNDRITRSLAKRLETSHLMLLQTYPGEVYPLDNCAVIGSIGLYDRATGTDHSKLIRDWVLRCRKDYLDPVTGLLIQAVDPGVGSPIDHGRGSGSCFGSYFLSFVDLQLSRDLYNAVRRELAHSRMGFGLVREYPRGIYGGLGDIDSGPILFGFGVSATGFCVAGSRIHSDQKYFRRLYSTVHLFGAPIRWHGKFHFVTGGPLGDAIMFAMLTANSHTAFR